MNDFVRNKINLVRELIAIDDTDLLNHIILERQLLINLQGINCDEE